MFTGIIETLGTVTKLEQEGSNLHLTIQTPLASELKIDQSVAHNGVCLTVIAINDDSYTVTAIEETLLKTNLGNLAPGDLVNLERAETWRSFRWHIVQGHVDQMESVLPLGNMKEVGALHFNIILLLLMLLLKKVP